MFQSFKRDILFTLRAYAVSPSIQSFYDGFRKYTHIMRWISYIYFPYTMDFVHILLYNGFRTYTFLIRWISYIYFHTMDFVHILSYNGFRTYIFIQQISYLYFLYTIDFVLTLYTNDFIHFTFFIQRISEYKSIDPSEFY